MKLQYSKAFKAVLAFFTSGLIGGFGYGLLATCAVFCYFRCNTLNGILYASIELIATGLLLLICLGIGYGFSLRRRYLPALQSSVTRGRRLMAVLVVLLSRLVATLIVIGPLSWGGAFYGADRVAPALVAMSVALGLWIYTRRWDHQIAALMVLAGLSVHPFASLAYAFFHLLSNLAWEWLHLYPDFSWYYVFASAVDISALTGLSGYWLIRTIKERV